MINTSKLTLNLSVNKSHVINLVASYPIQNGYVLTKMPQGKMMQDLEYGSLIEVLTNPW